ncbi:MAG: PQQ-binding-like beta-propeller repeat protein [Armatimonadota bacterium]
MKRHISLIMICLVVLVTSCQAAVRRVSVNGPGTDSDDGDSWSNAYSNIQTAIDYSSSGDEVWIQGYSDGSTVYNQKIALKNGVSIKGGYTGIGEDRDLGDNPSIITTISGLNKNDCVVYVPSGINRSAVIEYCTIRDGFGRLVTSNRYGGGIYCTNASPTISHCNIRNNAADYGGGIYADSSSAPDIEYCAITSNSTPFNGGGLYIYNGTCIHNNISSNISGSGCGVYIASYIGGMLVFRYNTISSNTKFFGSNNGCGGGVYLSGSTYIDFSNNDISNNSAWEGGGIFSSGCNIRDCNVTNNTASRHGGGISIYMGVNCSISGCVISGNKVNDQFSPYSQDFGGGIYSNGSSCTISMCEISNNKTWRGSGGGIYDADNTCVIFGNNITGNQAGYSSSYAVGCGGGIYTGAYSSSTNKIYCNVIKDNTSRSTAGGVYIGAFSSSSIFANNTVVNNIGGLGGGTACTIYVNPSSVPVGLYNNIIANNTGIGYGLYVSSGYPYYSYRNCFYNNSTDYNITPANGTIDTIFNDPGFDLDGYHLTSDSSCIDMGNDVIVGTSWTDIDGQLRKVDIIPGDAQVDTGAHEYTNAAIPIDTMTLTADPKAGKIGQNECVTVTANIKDSSGNNIANRSVYFSQTGGNLVSPTLGYARTDSSGNATAVITRSSEGKVTITAYEYWSSATRVTQTLDVWFFDTAADDWPMYMHDERHTGMSKTWDISSETLADPEWVADVPTCTYARNHADTQWFVGNACHPNPGWTVTGTDTFIFEHPFIDSSPVAVGNKVVVGTWDNSGDYLSSTGSVKAFYIDGANKGQSVWSQVTYNPSMGGVASTPCILDGRVYVGTANGYLYCLNLSDGSQVWARETTDRSATPASSKILSSPIVHNGVVYITNEASKVYAFTADVNGTPIGNPIVLPIEQSGHGDYGNGVTDVDQQNICGASSPAIATVGSNTYLLVGCDDGWLYRLAINADGSLVSPGSGDQLFMGGCVESSPSVSGNYAYVGVSVFYGKNIRRVQIEPFEEVTSWQVGDDSGQETRACVSLAYDFAYAGVDTGHEFFKLDANATGEYLDQLAVFSHKFIFSMPGSPTPPTITNFFVGSAAHTTGGIVYTGNDNGHFYALNADDLTPIILDGYYDNTIQTPGHICSSPAITYNTGVDNSRWVFITTRADGGKLYAFKTSR